MAKTSDALDELVEAAEQSETIEHDERPRGRLSARKEKARARRVRALAYRLSGLSNQQIGAQLGVSEQQASKMVQQSLQKAENPLVEEMRDLENQRLDRAQAAIWGDVLKGDLKAIDVFLRISGRRAKLNGLDEPDKVDISMSVKQEMETALSNLENIVLGDVVEDPNEIARNAEQGALAGQVMPTDDDDDEPFDVETADDEELDEETE